MCNFSIVYSYVCSMNTNMCNFSITYSLLSPKWRFVSYHYNSKLSVLPSILLYVFIYTLLTSVLYSTDYHRFQTKLCVLECKLIHVCCDIICYDNYRYPNPPPLLTYAVITAEYLIVRYCELCFTVVFTLSLCHFQAAPGHSLVHLPLNHSLLLYAAST